MGTLADTIALCIKGASDQRAARIAALDARIAQLEQIHKTLHDRVLELEAQRAADHARR